MADCPYCADLGCAYCYRREGVSKTAGVYDCYGYCCVCKSSPCQCEKTPVDKSSEERREKWGLTYNPLDVQPGGDHYKRFAIQPVEFITKNKLSFLQGDVVKRITRHNLPTGKGLQDLEKIKHEIDLIMALEYGDEEAEDIKIGGSD